MPREVVVWHKAKGTKKRQGHGWTRKKRCTVADILFYKYFRTERTGWLFAMVVCVVHRRG